MRINGLSVPPWAKGAPAPSPTIIHLEVQARPERIRKGGTLEYAYAYATFHPGGSRALEPARQKEMVATIASNVERGVPLGTSDICWLPHEEGLALWNRLDVKFRYDTWALRTITAVYGEASLDATFARIARGEVVDPTPGPNFTPIITAVDGVAQVDSPRTAAVMMRAYFDEPKKSDARGVAEDWFLRLPETAAVALIPLAVGPLGKARDEAGELLRMLVRRGHGAKVKRVAKSYGDAAAEAVDDVLAKRAPKKTKEPKLPAYLADIGDREVQNLLRYAMAWPPELVEESEPAEEQNPFATPAPRNDDEDPLELEQVFKVHVADWHPCLLEAKRTCDPAEIRALGVALYDAWLASGNKDKWVLFTAAFFGGDDVARSLGSQIRKWKAGKENAKALLGLDALVLAETDFALGVLDSLAHREELKSLMIEAGFRVRKLARAKGLSRDEIEDRVVPDLGLDDRSSRVLPSGGRVVLGEDLELRVDGKPDEELAAMRETLREIAPVLLRRLESALVMRKRWRRDVFDKYVAGHPVVGLLARRLVFGAYDPKDVLRSTFRVTADRTLADAQDCPVELVEGQRVGLVHPVELEASALRAWSDRLAEHEIVQPFPQIGRETFRIEAAERDAKVLARLRGRRVSASALIGLERAGWRRSRDQTHTSLMTGYSRWVGPSLDVHVSFSPGIELRKLGAAGPQTLGDAVLRPVHGGFSFVTDEHVPFGELDPVTFSEIVRAFSTL